MEDTEGWGAAAVERRGWGAPLSTATTQGEASQGTQDPPCAPSRHQLGVLPRSPWPAAPPAARTRPGVGSGTDPPPQPAAPRIV